MKAKTIFTSVMILLASAALYSCQPSGQSAEPELTLITDASDLQYDAGGGEGFFSFQIADTREDGQFAVEVQEGCDWITDAAVESYNVSGTVSFTLSPLKEDEDRNAVITVIYTYGGGRTVTLETTVGQQADEYDYNVKAENALNTYEGTYDTDNYYYTLSLSAPSVKQEYSLSILTTIESQDKLLPEGTYIVADADNFTIDEETGIVQDLFSFFIWIDDTGYENYVSIVRGSLEVSREGNEFTIYGVFTDENFDTHKVTYKGELPLEDISDAS